MKLFIHTASIAVMTFFLASASQASVLCAAYNAKMNSCSNSIKGETAQSCAKNGMMLASVCRDKVQAVSKQIQAHTAALKAKQHH